MYGQKQKHEPMCQIGIYVNINFFVTFCPFIVSRNNSKTTSIAFSYRKTFFLSPLLTEKYKQNAAHIFAFIAPFDEINIISNVSGAALSSEREEKNL